MVGCYVAANTSTGTATASPPPPPPAASPGDPVRHGVLPGEEQHRHVGRFRAESAEHLQARPCPAASRTARRRRAGSRAARTAALPSPAVRISQRSYRRAMDTTSAGGGSSSTTSTRIGPPSGRRTAPWPGRRSALSWSDPGDAAVPPPRRKILWNSFCRSSPAVPKMSDPLARLRV